MILTFTMCFQHLAAASLAERFDADFAKSCWDSCGTSGFGDVFDTLSATLKADVSKELFAQKTKISKYCGTTSLTMFEALIQQSDELIASFENSVKTQRKLERTAAKVIKLLKADIAKINMQTKGVLATIADVENRLAPRTMKTSADLRHDGIRISENFLLGFVTNLQFDVKATNVGLSKAIEKSKSMQRKLKAVSSSIRKLQYHCGSKNLAQLVVLIIMLQADGISISPCHANVLITVRLQSLVKEWAKLESQVSSAPKVSYQQQLEVFKFQTQARFLRDIGLEQFFEDLNVQDILKF